VGWVHWNQDATVSTSPLQVNDQEVATSVDTGAALATTGMTNKAAMAINAARRRDGVPQDTFM
jgi:hypothetical protein